jgi:hypothetical protein
MANKKVKKKLDPSNNKPKEYKCPAEDPREEEVILLFNNAPDKNKYDVVKLERTSLPTTYNGKTVDWISNFGIKEKNNDKYADMSYTVILSPRTGQTLVCYNGATDQFHPITVYDAPSDYPGKIAFDLTIGDPGSGWVGT